MEDIIQIWKNVTFKRVNYGSQIFTGKNGRQVRKAEEWSIYLNNVNLSVDQLDDLHEAFESAGDQFTPKWLKDFDGNINLHSKFDIPTKINGVICPTADIDGGDDCFGNIKVVVKDGAVYPVAIAITQNGTPYNPFEDM